MTVEMRKYRSISGLVKVRWMIAVKARTSSQLSTEGLMRPCFSYRFSTLSLAMASSQPHSTIRHKVGIFKHYSSGRGKPLLRPQLAGDMATRERLKGKI